MENYSRRKNESSGIPLGEDIVIQLLSKIADPSRPEFRFDNFLRSYNLFNKLADTRIRSTASWKIYKDIHGKNSMPQLEFRRDITMNMLCSKPKLISQPGPKIFVSTEIRKTDNPFLKSASQG
ncbi:hypothetical protein NPIL_236861 [Nephila pilipes]|uniref:Uncharacterized protein n=1 Tax=Nephila pilipes TaxID=299642 RepID=A0A8X6UJ74_NEPPI|nr:hypothetical protein NPIL_236861 [Nephila pilipes]